MPILRHSVITHQTGQVFKSYLRNCNVGLLELDRSLVPQSLATAVEAMMSPGERRVR